MRFPALALVPALLLLVACEKDSGPPSVDDGKAPANAGGGTEIHVPASVPDSFKAKFNELWPEVERAGERFTELFDKAQTARKAGKRDEMLSLIEQASGHAETVRTKWAEIYYTHFTDKADDGVFDEATTRKVERFLAPYNQKVKRWNSKIKAMKENTTVR